MIERALALSTGEILLLIALRGGVSIKNLKLSKTSLMANNVFIILNGHNVLWVDVIQQKFGKFNCWADAIPA